MAGIIKQSPMSRASAAVGLCSDVNATIHLPNPAPWCLWLVLWFGKFGPWTGREKLTESVEGADKLFVLEGQSVRLLNACICLIVKFITWIL